MEHFISVSDVANIHSLLEDVRLAKENPHRWANLGLGKSIAMIFLNPSLRTRMSTERAAQLLGMDVLAMNTNADGWQLEFEDGVVMNAGSAEHVKDAARVLGSYVDFLAVRSFPGLKNQEEDYAERVIKHFKEHAKVPVINLESATLHPLQSLTDTFTIEQNKKSAKPKVVLSWAPHVKALPQSVPNSFVQWMRKMDYELVITHPNGYHLKDEIVGDAKVELNQEKALEGADFVYVKNWSSYTDYGKMLHIKENWTMTDEKMELTNNGRFMHCMPIRRNLIAEDSVIDHPLSLMYEQAQNRLYAAMAVLKNLLEQKK